MPVPTLSLYETLTGQFANGLRIDQVDESEQPLLSVLDTLQRVFASRQGAVAHVPDFGLPDLAQMLDAHPAARQAICRDVCDAVLAAEPRVLQAHAAPGVQSVPGQFSIELNLELVGGGRHDAARRLPRRTPRCSRHCANRACWARPGGCGDTIEPVDVGRGPTALPRICAAT
ncbi:GPW/gp25 family protein [Pseudomonas sp. KNUC1026]|uniref:GPW/gp25 family protein n=1 Tax=Pseudomonas sp. KNUC1026 TaxID=2893890 RepID=UPI003FA76BF4